MQDTQETERGALSSPGCSLGETRAARGHRGPIFLHKIPWVWEDVGVIHSFLPTEGKGFSS